MAQQHGAEQALTLQQQMQAEQRNLQRLSAAKAWADRLSHARFVQEQDALVPKLAPDLADQKEGGQRREQLGRFLLGQGRNPGLHPPNVRAGSGRGLRRHAVAQRKGQGQGRDDAESATRSRAAETHPRQARRQRTPAKPGGSAQQNRIAALSNKRQLTIDEAVELHNLKGLQ